MEPTVPLRREQSVNCEKNIIPLWDIWSSLSYEILHVLKDLN